MTIPAGVFFQIILMIRFCRVKGARKPYFCYRRVVPGDCGFEFGENTPRFGALFCVRYKNCRPVLRTPIVSLPVRRGGIVHAEKMTKEVGI